LKEEKKDEKSITYQSIIEKVKDIVIKNPKWKILIKNKN